MFNKFYSSESGNIFFALFGAVIIVGLLGTVVVSTMRGPLSTMVNVQTRTKAESEMDIASRLVLLEATQLANDGDCDSDGFVEPLEYKDAAGAGPTGGGFLPNVIASSRIDPWGIEYGYCAWDAGGTTNAIACDTDSSGTNDRLDGNGDPSDETYTVIAVISAGQDQIFQTVCNGGASPSITKGGDDIVVEFTYGTAIAATNGLWNIKSGDPSTAEIGKNLEVTGGASFTAGIDLTSSTAALQLGAASMLFPNETTLITCNGANGGLIRIDTSSDPDVLQICDAVNGWVPVSSSFWSAGAGNDIYYNSGTPQVGIGTTTPAEALDVAGNIALTGNLVAGGSLSGADLSTTGNATIGGTLGVTGATTLTTLNSTAAVDFDTTLNVDGATTLGRTLNVAGSSVFVSTIDAQGTISSSTGDLNIGDNLIVTGTSDLQGAVSSSTGNLTLNDAVDITGAIDAQSSISNSTGNLALSDNVDVTGDASVSGDITATNITASATLNAGTTVNVNGDQLGPALNCAAAQKLVWTNGAGWSCDTDLQGGSGGGTPNLQDVLTTGNDAATLSAVNLGGVGIGTASPSAELHIDEGDLLVTGTYTGTSAVPVSGAGTRMFFQPATGAFRAGRVTGTQWDDTNIGNYSAAFGYNTRAAGPSSFAAGSSAYAANSSSIALGSAAQATNNFSHAIGDGAKATGVFSYAFGSDATASGGGSVAIGDNVTASGSRSIAISAGEHSNPFPIVSGNSSFGIFMGDQSGVDLTQANNMGVFGGKMVIDPAIPATNLVADTALEIEGTIKIADGGEACAAGIAGAIRYNGGNLSYCNGTSWQLVTSSGTAVTEINDLSDAYTDYTTDNNMFLGQNAGSAIASGGVQNTSLGINSLQALTTGDYNTAFGYNALGSAVDTLYNTAIGDQSLDALANGANGGGNVAIGRVSLTSLTSGWHNTALGTDSMLALTNGDNNTAIGSSALDVMNSGWSNVSIGRDSGSALTGGSRNIFLGIQAGYSHTSGNDNIIIGYQTNASNLTGSEQLNIGDILFGDLGTTSTDPKIGAYKYCDESLANCFVSSDVSGGNSDIFEVTGAAGSEVVSSINANVPYTTADFVFGSPQLADDTDTNHDNRMFFDKSKGAFRAGTVTGSQWDDTNVGGKSTAFGYNTQAKQLYSFASGHSSVANGDTSTAMGWSVNASGDWSFAAGMNVGTQTRAGIALGEDALSVANNSFAFGMGTASGASPQVSGASSFGIFMGDQSGVDLTQANTMALIGGSLGIGTVTPSSPLHIAYAGGTEDTNPATITLNNTTIQGSSILQFREDTDYGMNVEYWSSSDGTQNQLRFEGSLLGTPTGNIVSIDRNTSHMGILTTPATALDVAGTVKIADGGEACAAGVAGAMRYNTGTIDFCDGTSWTTLSSGASTSDIFEVTGGLVRTIDTNVPWNTSDFVIGSASTENSAFVTHRSRMFYDKSKGAFRAGYSLGTQWDDVNRGTYSIAMGSNTIASGGSSTAMGDTSTASGYASTATGAYVIAAGNSSAAIGREAQASGDNSFAFGLGVPAGTDPIVSGNNSFGIFMGDQSGVDLTQANTMALMGGSLGIGTVTPGWALDINAGTPEVVKIKGNGSASNIFFTNTSDTWTGNVGSDNSGNRFVVSSGTNDLVLMTGSSNVSWGTERARVLNSNGNTGIGTVSPTTRLDIAGTVKIADGGEACAAGVAGAMRYNTGTIDFCDGTSWQTFSSSGSLTAAGNNTELQFNNSGILGADSNLNWDNTAKQLTLGSALSLSNTALAINGNNKDIVIRSYGNKPDIYASRANGVLGAPSNITDGDTLFQIATSAYYGGNWYSSSNIKFQVDGTPSANDMPGRITFSTTPDGSATASERMRIDNAGNVGIGTTSPTAALHVNSGTNMIRATEGNAQRFLVDTTSGHGRLTLYNGAQTANIVLHSSVGNSYINTGANMGIGTRTPATLLDVDGTLKIADSGEACTAGIAGAMRYNTGTIDFCDGTNWTTLAATGGTTALSGLTAATATNTIANANYAQIWNWDTLTTETAMALGSTSITSGNILDINSSATAFTGTMADLTLSGSNAANTGTVLKSSVTGTSSAAVPIMATNAGTGASFRVNDDGTDTDTTPFIIDNDGNVGIGTANPSALLNVTGAGDTIEIAHISNTAFGSDNTLLLENTNGGGNAAVLGFKVNGTQQSTLYGWDAGLDINTTGEMWLTTGGSVRMTVKQAGNIGIGTSSPSALLHAADGDLLVTGTYTGTSAVPVTGAGTRLFFQPATGAFRAGTVTGGQWNDANMGDYSFATGLDNQVSGAYGFATGKSNTVSNNSAIALGDSNDVSGQGGIAMGNQNTVSSQDGIAFGVQSSVSGQESIAIGNQMDVTGDNSFGIALGSSGYTLNASNTMAIMGGNVGIGTTSPAAELDVSGTGSIIVSRGTEAQRPTAVDGMIRYKTDTGTSSIGFEVREAGAWVAMGAAVSDRRLKENIKPLSGKEILDRLAKINTYSYTMKNDKTGRKQYGVIAQELSDTFPELVDGTPDDSDNMMSVRYISLIAPIIEATKELKSENDMLKNNITALKTAQNETNATLKKINEQITLLNRAAGNNVGKASMQPFLLLLLGLIAGMGVIIIIQRKKIK